MNCMGTVFTFVSKLNSYFLFRDMSRVITLTDTLAQATNNWQLISHTLLQFFKAICFG